MSIYKPCPFCGGVPAWKHSFGGKTIKKGKEVDLWFLWLQCDDCRGRAAAIATTIPPEQWGEQEKHAAQRKWNRRYIE